MPEDKDTMQAPGLAYMKVDPVKNSLKKISRLCTFNVSRSFHNFYGLTKLYFERVLS